MALTRRSFLASAVLGAAGAVAGKLRPAAAAADPFAKLDAVAQAALVRGKEATPLELVDAAIARIERLNPSLNAFVTKLFAEARSAAKGKLPEGPLTGVPYAVKDLHDYAGTRNTSGSRLFADMVSTRSDGDIESALAAGVVMVGKTNVPEFGLLASTESLLLGPARNPWNVERSTGGSSGGAAAAVASGMLPFAHASDGGGSIRIPASCCGVFGLKPSRGRIVVGPGPDLPGDIAVEHCVSRTVRDSALLFSVSEDRSAGAMHPPVGYVEGPSKKRLKIAFGTTSQLGEEPDAEVKSALEATAKLCAELGHHVVPVDQALVDRRFIDHFLTVWAVGPAELVVFARRKGVKPADVLEPWTLGLAEMLAKKPKGALDEALAYFREVDGKVDAFFASGYDVWLTPVLRSPPPKIGEQAPTVPFDTLLERVTRYVSYTPVHNVAGTPAMSVPLGWTKSGLPIGSHFAARKGGEATLFALAYELEQARPWKDKWPGKAAVG